MAARVQVVAGPAGAGKTQRLAQIYRPVLAQGVPGAALWIAPNHRTVAEVRHQLLTPELRGCFRPGIVTFEQFAEAVLQASERPVRPLSRLMKRQLLAQLVDEANDRQELEYLQPIVGRPGLLDALGDFIAELKRLEIWPEHLAAAGGRRNALPKDRELAALYTAYQSALIQHELYDAEGRFWSARELLRAGQRKPYETLRTVVVDGFADFSHTQFEILELLAPRIEQLVVSLPLEQATARHDLFAKPGRTLDELERRFARLTVEWLERPAAPVWPAIDHLERTLFLEADAASESRSAAGIEVLGAAQAFGEIEVVGRQIKRLLSAGDGGQPVRPGDVAVVFRSTTEAAPLVREVFDELGIPYALDARRTLLDCRAISALLGFLRLEVENWPFRQVIAAVEQTYFQPDWSEWAAGKARVAADETIRELQIAEGRLDLLDGVRRWSDHVISKTPEATSEEDPRARSRARRSQRAQLARPLIERLAEALRRLPQQATLAEWAVQLGRLASDLGVRAVAATAITPDDPGQSEPEALERLIESLKTADRLFEWLGQPAPKLDRQEALARIEDLADHEAWPGGSDETGRVRVLSALNARGLRVPYLFVAGLSESAFPAGERASALFGRQDHGRLMAAGLKLPPWGAHSQDEMLLFYETVTRATRRLTLSYPAVDGRAQPLSPSPYLDDVRRLFGAGLPGVVDVDLRPAPLQGEPAGPMDLRLQGMLRALDDSPSLLTALRRETPKPATLPVSTRSARGSRTQPAPGQRALFAMEPNEHVTAALSNPRLLDNLLSGLRMLGSRQDREQFGRFEGLLTAPGVSATLGQKFSDSFCWSPTALEQYRACPFKFFLAKVLEVDSPADLELQEDYGLRGNLLHAVLADVHRRINKQAGGPTSPCTLEPAEFHELFDDSLLEAIKRYEKAPPLERAWREIDADLIRRWGRDYLDQQQAYELTSAPRKAPSPERFELGFGPSRHQDGADDASEARPLELARGGEIVRIAGRIDRVDVLEDGAQTLFAVVDYKSGRAQRVLNDMKRDVALQLQLYAMAVQRLFFPDRAAAPAQAAYWFVREEGCKKGSTLQFEAADENGLVADREGKKGPVIVDWQELQQKTTEQVFVRVAGVRQGQFPVVSVDDKCTGQCEFRTVCRVNHVRALEKAWQFPELPPS